MNNATIRRYFTLILLLITRLQVMAQNPDLATDNLKVTREVFAANHLIAQVSLETEEKKYARYRYDGYSDIIKITTPDGISYVKAKVKPWRKSNDWGKTGTSVSANKAQELDTYVAVVKSPLLEPVIHDKSQGDTVWKLIAQKKADDYELFTYERGRQIPKADGTYPRYTFIKYKNDIDGKLLLEHFSGQMRSGADLIPIEIHFEIMIKLPSDTIIQVVPEKAR